MWGDQRGALIYPNPAKIFGQRLNMVLFGQKKAEKPLLGWKTKKGGVNKKGLRIAPKPLDFLAGSTGLEPAASGVTGRRYNRLNYDPAPDVGRRNRI